LVFDIAVKEVDENVSCSLFSVTTFNPLSIDWTTRDDVGDLRLKGIVTSDYFGNF
jgi:hypothetical protein